MPLNPVSLHVIQIRGNRTSAALLIEKHGEDAVIEAAIYQALKITES